LIKNKLSEIHICVNSIDTVHCVMRTIPLAEAGFCISFIAHNEFDTLDELRKYDNVRIYLLKDFAPEKKRLRINIYVDLLKKLNPDLIIVHFCAYDGFQAAVLSNIKPIVGIIMGGDLDNRGSRLPYYIYMDVKFSRLLLPYIDLLSVKSNHLKSLLEELNPLGGMFVNPWGIKVLDKYDYSCEKISDKFKISKSDFVVLSNRTVADSGRIKNIIEGFLKFSKDKNNVKLLVIEQKPDKVYLKYLYDYVERNNAEDKVIFSKNIPFEEIFRYYKLSNVLVSIWRHDGIPQTLFEAGYCNTAMIINDLPQFHDFFQNEHDVLYFDGSADDLSKKLNIMYFNKSIYEKLKKNVRETVIDKANIDHLSELFINKILNLLEKKKKIKIPKTKLLYGKFILFISFVSKRKPLFKITVKI